jgi:hypothetical protein
MFQAACTASSPVSLGVTPSAGALNVNPIAESVVLPTMTEAGSMMGGRGWALPLGKDDGALP